MRSEILGVRDNTLTANYEYSRVNRENLQLPNSAKLSKKAEIFRGIFLHFWNHN